jgi:hypothetical protein
MAARLAFSHIAQSAHSSGKDASSSQSAPSAGATASGQAAQAASPAATQGSGAAVTPAVLQGKPLRDVSFLCYANTPKPYPEPWQQQYAALQPALERAAAAAGVKQEVDMDW